MIETMIDSGIEMQMISVAAPRAQEERIINPVSPRRDPASFTTPMIEARTKID